MPMSNQALHEAVDTGTGTGTNSPGPVTPGAGNKPALPAPSAPVAQITSPATMVSPGPPGSSASPAPAAPPAPGGPAPGPGNDPDDAPADELFFLAPRRSDMLIGYCIGCAFLSAAALVYLVVEDDVSQSYGGPLTATLASVLSAGALGAALCNLRGLFTHADEKGGRIPARLEIPYYVRPVTGLLTGLISFFAGNLMVVSLSTDPASRSWQSLSGRLPFIAVAILAGFAAQEFMERLKQTAGALFSEGVRGKLHTRLEQLKALHDGKVIDDDEYKARKRLVLDDELRSATPGNAGSPEGQGRTP